jgi:aminopeptidase N
MSTYLVAFLVSEFEKVSSATKRGVKVSVYSRPEFIADTSLSVQVAADSLDFYEEWFGIQYPLPKLDSVAVPDFAAG